MDEKQIEEYVKNFLEERQERAECWKHFGNNMGQSGLLSWTQNSSGDDVSNLYEKSVDLIVGRLDEKCNERFVSLISDSVLSNGAGSSGRVMTGASGGNVTPDNAIAKLSSVLGKVPARYRDGGFWIMSTDTFEIVGQSTSSSGEFALRPAMRDGVEYQRQRSRTMSNVAMEKRLKGLSSTE